MATNWLGNSLPDEHYMVDHILDDVTHNHSARDQEGINFFIYW